MKGRAEGSDKEKTNVERMNERDSRWRERMDGSSTVGSQQLLQMAAAKLLNI